MPLKSEVRSEDDRLSVCRQKSLAALSTEALLAELLSESEDFGRLAVVSSFGSESAVLLHQIAKIAPETPVIFIDTLFHFDETLAYRDALVEQLSLRDVRSLSIDPLSQKRLDPARTLHLTDPDQCCHARKVEVLRRALRGFDGWITGQKRYQSDTRAAIARVEWDTVSDKWKFNPLADWTADQIETYRDRHGLPRHPLAHLGYTSVGCAPCTSPVADHEHSRAGRWRGQQKLECGLHRNPNIIAASAA
ncbi:MAG: phosphoadenylyl-sulfate reductase [Halieaceae bacterium]